MTARKAGGAKAPGRATAPKPQQAKTLPPITIAKFEATGELLERVVASSQTEFVDAGQSYKEQHRQGSSRPLTASEAAQVAATLGDDTTGRVAELQQSELRAYDEAALPEVLLAAGLRTAPTLVKAFRQVVALVEMDNDLFREVYENGTLPETIQEKAQETLWAELGDGRRRTAAAMAHYARSAGFEPGEAWGLPVSAIWQALRNAASQLQPASASSLLTGFAESTPGPSNTSSTD